MNRIQVFGNVLCDGYFKYDPYQCFTEPQTEGRIPNYHPEIDRSWYGEASHEQPYGFNNRPLRLFGRPHPHQRSLSPLHYITCRKEVDDTRKARRRHHLDDIYFPNYDDERPEREDPRSSLTSIHQREKQSRAMDIMEYNKMCISKLKAKRGNGNWRRKNNISLTSAIKKTDAIDSKKESEQTSVSELGTKSLIESEQIASMDSEQIAPVEESTVTTDQSPEVSSSTDTGKEVCTEETIDIVFKETENSEKISNDITEDELGKCIKKSSSSTTVISMDLESDTETICLDEADHTVPTVNSTIETLNLKHNTISLAAKHLGQPVESIVTDKIDNNLLKHKEKNQNSNPDVHQNVSSKLTAAADSSNFKEDENMEDINSNQEPNSEHISDGKSDEDRSLDVDSLNLPDIPKNISCQLNCKQSIANDDGSTNICADEKDTGQIHCFTQEKNRRLKLIEIQLPDDSILRRNRKYSSKVQNKLLPKFFLPENDPRNSSYFYRRYSYSMNTIKDKKEQFPLSGNCHKVNERKDFDPKRNCTVISKYKKLNSESIDPKIRKIEKDLSINKFNLPRTKLGNHYDKKNSIINDKTFVCRKNEYEVRKLYRGPLAISNLCCHVMVSRTECNENNIQISSNPTNVELSINKEKKRLGKIYDSDYETEFINEISLNEIDTRKSFLTSSNKTNHSFVEKDDIDLHLLDTSKSYLAMFEKYHDENDSIQDGIEAITISVQQKLETNQNDHNRIPHFKTVDASQELEFLANRVKETTGVDNQVTSKTQIPQEQNEKDDKNHEMRLRENMCTLKEMNKNNDLEKVKERLVKFFNEKTKLRNVDGNKLKCFSGQSVNAALIKQRKRRLFDPNIYDCYKVASKITKMPKKFTVKSKIVKCTNNVINNVHDKLTELFGDDLSDLSQNRRNHSNEKHIDSENVITTSILTSKNDKSSTETSDYPLKRRFSMVCEDLMHQPKQITKRRNTTPASSTLSFNILDHSQNFQDDRKDIEHTSHNGSETIELISKEILMPNSPTNMIYKDKIEDEVMNSSEDILKILDESGISLIDSVISEIIGNEEQQADEKLLQSEDETSKIICASPKKLQINPAESPNISLQQKDQEANNKTVFSHQCNSQTEIVELYVDLTKDETAQDSHNVKSTEEVVPPVDIKREPTEEEIVLQVRIGVCTEIKKEITPNFLSSNEYDNDNVTKVLKFGVVTKLEEEFSEETSDLPSVPLVIPTVSVAPSLQRACNKSTETFISIEKTSNIPTQEVVAVPSLPQAQFGPSSEDTGAPSFPVILNTTPKCPIVQNNQVPILIQKSISCAAKESNIDSEYVGSIGAISQNVLPTFQPNRNSPSAIISSSQTICQKTTINNRQTVSSNHSIPTVLQGDILPQPLLPSVLNNNSSQHLQESTQSRPQQDPTNQSIQCLEFMTASVRSMQNMTYSQQELSNKYSLFYTSVFNILRTYIPLHVAYNNVLHELVNLLQKYASPYHNLNEEKYYFKNIILKKRMIFANVLLRTVKTLPNGLVGFDWKIFFCGLLDSLSSVKLRVSMIVMMEYLTFLMNALEKEYLEDPTCSKFKKTLELHYQKITKSKEDSEYRAALTEQQLATLKNQVEFYIDLVRKQSIAKQNSKSSIPVDRERNISNLQINFNGSSTAKADDKRRSKSRGRDVSSKTSVKLQRMSPLQSQLPENNVAASSKLPESSVPTSQACANVVVEHWDNSNRVTPYSSVCRKMIERNLINYPAATSLQLRSINLNQSLCTFSTMGHRISPEMSSNSNVNRRGPETLLTPMPKSQGIRPINMSNTNLPTSVNGPSPLEFVSPKNQASQVVRSSPEILNRSSTTQQVRQPPTSNISKTCDSVSINQNEITTSAKELLDTRSASNDSVSNPKSDSGGFGTILSLKSLLEKPMLVEESNKNVELVLLNRNLDKRHKTVEINDQSQTVIDLERNDKIEDSSNIKIKKEDLLERHAEPEIIDLTWMDDLTDEEVTSNSETNDFLDVKIELLQDLPVPVSPVDSGIESPTVQRGFDAVGTGGQSVRVEEEDYPHFFSYTI